MVAVDLGVFDVLDGSYPVAVTPLGGAPVTTTVQWDQEDATPADQQVGSGAASAVNRRPVVYVRRDQVPSLPMGSTITGGPAHNVKSWKVVSIDSASDPDYHKAILV